MTSDLNLGALQTRHWPPGTQHIYLNGFLFFSVLLSPFFGSLSLLFYLALLSFSGFCFGLARDNPWSLFPLEPILSFHNTEPEAAAVYTWWANSNGYICLSDLLWAWQFFCIHRSVLHHRGHDYHLYMSKKQCIFSESLSLKMLLWKPSEVYSICFSSISKGSLYYV